MSTPGTSACRGPPTTSPPGEALTLLVRLSRPLLVSCTPVGDRGKERGRGEACCCGTPGDGPRPAIQPGVGLPAGDCALIRSPQPDDHRARLASPSEQHLRRRGLGEATRAPGQTRAGPTNRSCHLDLGRGERRHRNGLLARSPRRRDLLRRPEEAAPSSERYVPLQQPAHRQQDHRLGDLDAVRPPLPADPRGHHHESGHGAMADSHVEHSMVVRCRPTTGARGGGCPTTSTSR